MNPDNDEPSEPPPLAVEHDMPWPPRMASESFFSFGVFGERDAAEAGARLNGTVIASERRVNTQSGQEFTVARITSIGMAIDVCLSAKDHPTSLRVGQIISGTVFLVASIEALEPTPAKRRFWQRPR